MRCEKLLKGELLTQRPQRAESPDAGRGADAVCMTQKKEGAKG